MLVKAAIPDTGIEDAVLTEVQRCKLAVVGDNNSGKTCLLSSLMDTNLELDQMAIFEECIHNVEVGNKIIEFMLWDLSGQQDYDGLRVELYRETDVFLVCFDIGNPLSLSNAETVWIPELKEQEPDTPFILVGCKNDKREFNIECSHCVHHNTTFHTAVSKTTAERVALSSGAKSYVECCAKTRSNINEVFQTAGEIVAYNNSNPSTKTNDHHFSALRSITRIKRRKSADTNDIKHSPVLPHPTTYLRSRRGSVM